MQLPIIAHRGQTKPYGSIPRINWAHPLARGLVSYGYDAGSGPIDLVTGAQRTLVNTGAPFGGANSSKYGSGLKSLVTANAAASGLYTLPASSDISNLTAAAPYSFACGYMPLATPGSGAFVNLYGTCNATTSIPVQMGSSFAGTTDFWFSFGAGASQGTATGLLKVGSFQTLLGVALTSNTTAAYVDGILRISPAVATTGVATGIPNFFGYRSATQPFTTAFIYYGALWKNRALTASEARLLHDDPYCFLIYPEDEMFASLVGVAATSNPFQTGWVSPAQRVPLTLLQPSVSLNPNLQTNPVPNNQTDWSNPRRVVNQPPDQSLSLNPNLFANPVPNNQTDWSKPVNAPRWLPSPPQPLNLNLFRNPLPFNQVYWPSTFFPRVLGQPPAPLNLNLDNPVPFNQFDWSKPQQIRITQPQPQSGLNINLFTNPVPVANLTSAAPFAVRALPTPDQAYNPNLYGVVAVSVPLNQFDVAKPFFPRALALPSDPLNINLFTNPLPIANVGSATAAMAALPTPSQPYNPNVYGVVAVALPLNQSDFSKPFLPRALGLPSDPLNINLFTNPVPFNQTDWSSPPRRPIQPQPQAGLNVNLFTNPVPFGAADSGARRLASLTLPDQPYNVALYTVTVVAAQPFTQGDVPLVRRPLPAAVLSDPLNPNLFRNDVPIANVDASTPMRLRAATDPGQPLNLNLFGIFVPPVQLDVVVVARPRLTTTPASVFNPNLQTNDIPFSQFDYPLAHRVPAAPLDLSRGQPNPNIFTNPMPLLQSDITAPRSPRRTAPFEAVNVALLGTPVVTTPLPFNQYNFTPANKPQPQRRQDLLNPTLIASFVPPPPDAEHHSKPFFVTPGRLMNI